MIVVMLPGMDGTGKLFDPFIDALPWTIQTLRICYPTDIALSYKQLENRVLAELPQGEPFIVIAESYSGPIALGLASRSPEGLRAIILVASFVQRPFGKVGAWFACLPLGILFRIRPSRKVLRWLLMEAATPPQLVSLVQTTILSLDPEVLAVRTKDALTVNRTEDARSCPVPFVFLTGKNDRLLRSFDARAAGGSPGFRLLSIDGPHLLLQCKAKAAVAALAKLSLFDDLHSTDYSRSG